LYEPQGRALDPNSGPVSKTSFPHLSASAK